MAHQQSLYEFLSSPDSYPESAGQIQHIETHISHIYLTGKYAYKIKKPLKLDFLDFSTLELRHHYLERELKLNRRYAPELYLRVQPIFRSKNGYSFNEPGIVTEYALVMNQFDSNALFSVLLKSGSLSTEHILKIVETISHLHTTAERTPDLWSFTTVSRLALANIEVLQRMSAELGVKREVEELMALVTSRLEKHRDLIKKRQAYAVRSLHGDLHLGNICIYNGKPTLFDGLEFNDEYSCTDTWADIGFLFMDLEVKGRKDFAFRLLNRYLELTDDFEGVQLLKFYAAYRALIRAKVSAYAYRDHVTNSSLDSVQSYVRYAIGALKKGAGTKIICVGGLSGSGKSTLAHGIGASIGALIVRSDAVRKHLCGVPIDSQAPDSAYTNQMNEKTYEGMKLRGELIIDSGFPLIFDAAFLSSTQQRRMEKFAAEAGIPFFGIWCSVPTEIAEARIQNRSSKISDATPAVLAQQLAKFDGPSRWHELDTSGLKEETLSKALSLMLI